VALSEGWAWAFVRFAIAWSGYGGDAEKSVDVRPSVSRMSRELPNYADITPAVLAAGCTAVIETATPASPN
jgi:hypothetical protein